MIADHHATYDFTAWYIFIGVLLGCAVVVGIIIANMLDDEEKE